MLCRKQLILNVNNQGVLNYNYQYKLMKVLYEALTLENKEKAEMLHDEGFKLKSKTFKLFNYTLLFNKAKFSSNGIELNTNDEVKLILSGKEDIINGIIKGIVKMNSFNIDDISFKLINMINDKSVKFNKTMLYKVQTPIVETSIINNQKQYLNPFQPEFYNALQKNLKRKYELIYGEEYTGEIYFDIDNILKVKQKNINHIKNNGQIKGTGGYEIWIEANSNMQKVAYYCGLGQNNSTGAGLLTYITSRK